MLDLSVNLMKIHFLLPIALLLIAAQSTPPIAITSPAPDAIIGGEVIITGTTDVLGFASSQLDFSYASNPADTWFAVQSSSQPVTDSPLAAWDTTLISDGDYILRLRVYLEDGSFQEMTVPIKIQNDTPIVTPTLTLTSIPESVNGQVPTPFLVASSPTPTTTPRPTPTALPTNPVSLNQTTIYTSLGRGALVIIGLFLFAGLILRFRRY
jgi:hypothetical protein